MTNSSTQELVDQLDARTLLGIAVDQQESENPRNYTLPTDADLVEAFPELEKLELIGTGGMGCVFKMKQTKLDRIVALKILPRELADDTLFAERFSREARAMARLNHRNIVSIYDFGESRGLHYLVMEYKDGMNLRELLDSGRVDPDEAVEIFRQVCEALAFAHGEGVVHRDIKPENILFNRLGHVALADFGLARLAMDSHCEISLTATRQAMGTLNYMAPEQWENPKSVDHRADIYALGVLFYELLTGRVPRGSFPPASTIAGTSGNIDDVITRALQVEPDGRFQTVEDLMIAMSHPGSATPVPRRAGLDLDANGTFTNLRNVAAMPMRLLSRSPASEPTVKAPSRRWFSLPSVCVAAFLISLVLVLLPTQNGWPWIEVPEVVYAVCGFGGLAFFACIRRHIHPVRYFLIASALLLLSVTMLRVCMSKEGLQGATPLLLMLLTLLLGVEHIASAVGQFVKWLHDTEDEEEPQKR